jgi:hypothetical protein
MAKVTWKKNYFKDQSVRFSKKSASLCQENVYNRPTVDIDRII